MKMVHLLAKHGAKWMPGDRGDINSVRRSLLKLIPDYTVELAWIMAQYQGCNRTDLDTLLGSATMRRHLSDQRDRVSELCSQLESTPEPTPSGP